MSLQEELEKQGNVLFRYRSSLPFLVLAAGIIVFILESQNGMRSFFGLNYDQIEIVSLIISFFGLLIRIMAVAYTPANTSGRNTREGQLADELNQTGMYSMVRHPLYLGNFFMWLGAAVLVANPWFLLVFSFAYWIYYERIMFAEEQFLKRKFGANYADWADKTPPFLPAFSSFVKPKYTFSWKKVLKKEKNGVLAIFSLLLLFHMLNFAIMVQACPPPIGWIHWSFLGSLVLYLVLKFIKHKTHFLDETGR